MSADPTVYTSFDAIRFVSEHPLINELDVPQFDFSADEAIHTIQHLNFLNKFNFALKTYRDRMQFQAVWNRREFPWVEEWICDVMGGNVEMTRK